MTDDDYRRAGVTHFTIPPNETEAVLLSMCEENDYGKRDCTCTCQANSPGDHCEEFSLYQPYNQEGGPGPICFFHMMELGWTVPTPVKSTGKLCEWPY